MGAICKIIIIQISVLAPFYSHIWNVFHDGKCDPVVTLFIIVAAMQIIRKNGCD